MGGPVVLVGRSREKLAALQHDLDGDVSIRVAALDDPLALRDALDGCAAVVACAGPFARYGEPVVRAAIDARVHYLDLSGEQEYIRRIFDRYGDAAEAAGVALIPAVGIDSVPADMLAGLVAEDLGPLDQLTVVIDVRGGRTNTGSLLTMLDCAHRREGLHYANGTFGPAPRQLRGGRWDLAGGERVSLMRFAGAEVVLLPRHLDTSAVGSSSPRAPRSPAGFPASSGWPRCASPNPWLAPPPTDSSAR
jgi:hypothetical protein